MRAKMLAYFGMLFAVTLSLVQLAHLYGVPFTNYRGEYFLTEAEVSRNLNLIADLKKERLLRWIEERRDDATVLSENPLTVVSIEKLRVLAASGSRLKKSGSIDPWVRMRDSKVYSDFVNYLQLVKKTYAVYESMLVIDSHSGEIIVSTDESELGVNVSDQAYFKEVMRGGGEHSIQIARDLLQEDKFHLIVARGISTIANGLVIKDRIEAVLVLKVRPDDILKPMLHSGQALGSSGEVLLVNNDLRILTSLKHPLSDGTTAKPMEYKIHAEPAKFASEGEEGLVKAKDYRGKQVFAALRFLPITSDYGWGMVVKQDQSEIFIASRESNTYFYVISLGAVFLALFVISAIANNISKPIRIMSEAARRIESGDLDARAAVISFDEVGEMTQTFNAMIDRVQNWNQELEGRVRSRTEELEEKNAELERFTYTVSHDLKSPLITITGFLGFLEDDVANRDTQKIESDIKNINSAVTKMGRLLNDLLELSRIGRLVNVYEEVALVDSAQEAVELVGGELANKNIELTISKRLPVVSGDRARILEVFQNLIGNAAKFFGDQTKPVIEIGSFFKNEEEIIYVKDNGIGIESRYHESIFGLFERLDTGTEGTGIGLAITKRVVETHGGRIWVESEGKGKGSAFLFTFSKLEENTAEEET